MKTVIESVLVELERQNGQDNIYWNVPRTTGIFLNAVTRSIGAARVLEIGTSDGYSGIWFAEALSHTGGRLYTVESHKKRFAMAAGNFGKAGVESYVEQIFGHAPEILSSIPGPFDLIFIDATKMEYLSYAEVLVSSLRVGGLLIADNCISHAGEVADFLEYMGVGPEGSRGGELVNGVPSGRRESSAGANFRSVVLPLDNGLLFALKV